jgi:trk system potassium uptake protein TrkA
MKVIILGCGRVGSELAARLEARNHDITVIDRDPLAAERLSPGFKGRFIVGLGFDRQTLIEAGIEKADAFVATARGDNHNAVSSFIARNVFEVPKVIARIYNPERANIYWKMGISTISPVAWAVNEIVDFLVHPDVRIRASLGSGEVKIIECDCFGSLAGMTVKELDDKREIRVVSVVRRGHALMPEPGLVIEKGDSLVLAVTENGREKLQELLKG